MPPGARPDAHDANGLQLNAGFELVAEFVLVDSLVSTHWDIRRKNWRIAGGGHESCASKPSGSDRGQQTGHQCLLWENLIRFG